MIYNHRLAYGIWHISVSKIFILLKRRLANASTERSLRKETTWLHILPAGPHMSHTLNVGCFTGSLNSKTSSGTSLTVEPTRQTHIFFEAKILHTLGRLFLRSHLRGRSREIAHFFKQAPASIWAFLPNFFLDQHMPQARGIACMMTAADKYLLHYSTQTGSQTNPHGQEVKCTHENYCPTPKRCPRTRPQKCPGQYFTLCACHITGMLIQQN